MFWSKTQSTLTDAMALQPDSGSRTKQHSGLVACAQQLKSYKLPINIYSVIRWSLAQGILSRLRTAHSSKESFLVAYSPATNGPMGDPLLLEIWPAGTSSAINHGNTSGLLRVLHGSLYIFQYKDSKDFSPCEVMKGRVDDVLWMDSTLFQTHLVWNPALDPPDFAVAAHLYVGSSDMAVVPRHAQATARCGLVMHRDSDGSQQDFIAHSDATWDELEREYNSHGSPGGTPTIKCRRTPLQLKQATCHMPLPLGKSAASPLSPWDTPSPSPSSHDSCGHVGQAGNSPWPTQPTEEQVSSRAVKSEPEGVDSGEQVSTGDEGQSAIVGGASREREGASSYSGEYLSGFRKECWRHISDAAFIRHQELKDRHLAPLRISVAALVNRLKESRIGARKLSAREEKEVKELRRLILGLVLFLSAKRERIPARFDKDKMVRLEGEITQILKLVWKKI